MIRRHGAIELHVTTSRGISRAEQKCLQPSLRGDVVLQSSCKAAIFESFGEALAERFTGAVVVGETEIAADDVLQETYRGVQMHCVEHIGEDGRDGVETLCGGADVIEAHVIEQNFLHDEGSYGLGPVVNGKHENHNECDELLKFDS